MIQGWYSPQREFSGKVWDTEAPRPLTPLQREVRAMPSPVPVGIEMPRALNVDEQAFAAFDATKCVPQPHATTAEWLSAARGGLTKPRLSHGGRSDGGLSKAELASGLAKKGFHGGDIQCEDILYLGRAVFEPVSGSHVLHTSSAAAQGCL